ncbi:MAG: hypothetical protein Q4A06_10030 [Cardiobacteriaceae bacterium]|nr:hypothetical protein [Cardiobacteriaceae bacterium]
MKRASIAQIMHHKRQNQRFLSKAAHLLKKQTHPCRNAPHRKIESNGKFSHHKALISRKFLTISAYW